MHLRREFHGKRNLSISCAALHVAMLVLVARTHAHSRTVSYLANNIARENRETTLSARMHNFLSYDAKTYNRMDETFAYCSFRFVFASIR